MLNIISILNAKTFNFIVFFIMF